MKTPKQYNITPAKGQALLNFQGRRFPDKMDVYETEVIEEVRNRKAKDRSLINKETELNSDFRNLLIQGDCLSACAYLKSKNIKVDLVYIDPPFASGANYAKSIFLRSGKTFNRDKIKNDLTSIGEEIMYGDIWQKEDYLNWLYERLLAIKSILSENGNIFVHLDWRIGHYAKILLDEVFGEESFENEIIWHFRTFQGQVKDYFPRKHNTIYWYRHGEINTFELTYSYEFQKTVDYERWGKYLVNGNEIRGNNYPKDDSRFTGYYERWVKENRRKPNKNDIIMKVQGYVVDDVWTDIQAVDPKDEEEGRNYITQKPEALLERIIKAGSAEGMIIADFFSGSGTTAIVAQNLNRKYIAGDIGINAIQATRDGLVKAGASFDILKIQDGLRLFRNPTQTTAKIFSIIDGFKSRTDLSLNNFWDGGIAQAKGSYSPIKFSGIHDRLTKELLDVYLEEIYKLEDVSNRANEIIIIYAHKEIDIDQEYLNDQLRKTAKTELKVKLVSLDEMLEEKRDALFTPDNAEIKMTVQGSKYKVDIKKFYSPYLKNKVDEYNVKKTKKGMLEQDLKKAVKISDNGFELIEAVQFDTTLGKVWKSNSDLEDKAGISEKIKGSYILDTNKFKMKIRNIAGDEIVIESTDIST